MPSTDVPPEAFPPLTKNIGWLRKRNCPRWFLSVGLTAGGTLPANPLIAQALATLKLMEQRGSGFARMRHAMLNHGLDAPDFGEQDGYFVVTFPGPNGHSDRLRVPEDTPRLVSPAIEAQLNDRQRKIVRHVAETGSVNRRWCVVQFKVANDTAGRDLKSLLDLGVLVPQGKARAVRYILANQRESTDNRPTLS